MNVHVTTARVHIVEGVQEVERQRYVMAVLVLRNIRQMILYNFVHQNSRASVGFSVPIHAVKQQRDAHGNIVGDVKLAAEPFGELSKGRVDVSSGPV